MQSGPRCLIVSNLISNCRLCHILPSAFKVGGSTIFFFSFPLIDSTFLQAVRLRNRVKVHRHRTWNAVLDAFILIDIVSRSKTMIMIRALSLKSRLGEDQDLKRLPFAEDPKSAPTPQTSSRVR